MRPGRATRDERSVNVPWQGNHGWLSHLRGLETRHEHGNLSDVGYARALRRFAARFEEQAARAARFTTDRRSDLAHAARLRAKADSLDPPPPPKGATP